MTAFSSFPSIQPGSAAADPPSDACAEIQLVAAVLRVCQSGAGARLHATLGQGPGATVRAAHGRLVAALDRAPATPDALAKLVTAAVDGPDGEERARAMALGFVPAHRMQALVVAARDFGLTLRRAVLLGQGATQPASGAATCPRAG